MADRPTDVDGLDTHCCAGIDDTTRPNKVLEYSKSCNAIHCRSSLAGGSIPTAVAPNCAQSHRVSRAHAQSNTYNARVFVEHVVLRLAERNTQIVYFLIEARYGHIKNA